MIDGCSATTGGSRVDTSDAENGSLGVTWITIIKSPRSGTSPAGHGRRYDVHLDTGELLLGKSDEPIYDACRQLVGCGVMGRLKVWRHGKHHADFIVRDIDGAAAWTIEETAKVGPRLRKHRPMTAMAFSGRHAIAA